MRPFLVFPALSLFPVLFVAQPALAAEKDQPAATDLAEDLLEDRRDILVVATRIRGQVDTDIPPVITLDEEDVAAYGAASIGELLEAVSPQTGSGRGRGGGHPVILLNGQRISSFRQLRNIPPEAIRRMEVLPEEVALRFGYPPDQRLVNFILKENFSAVQAAGEYNIPSRGGFSDSELEAGLSRFDGPRRINLNWKMRDFSMLTEDERGLLQPEDNVPTVANDPDPARFRSLVADSVTHTFDGNWSTGLGGDGLNGSLTIDGLYEYRDSLSLSGLDTVLLTAPDGTSELRSLHGALERETRTDTFEAGLTLNKPVAGWQLTATADAGYVDASTRIERQADVSGLIDAAASGLLAIDGALPDVPDPGFDRAREKDLSLETLVTLTGRPFRLPAGEASLTIDAGYDHLSSDNSDTRGSGIAANLKRDTVSAGLNLALPITSRKAGVLGGIGDITLSLGGGIDELSDFGTLTDWNAGITWSPFEALTLQASYIVNEDAPGLSELGQPEIRTFNVPVYDFARGEAALVTIIGGGNADLLAEKQRDIKLSANYDLDLFRRSSLIVEYFRNTSDNVTRSFPLLTPAVETAFPDRATRDVDGTLLSIDRRPVTFSEVKSSNLRWGLNLSGAVAKEKPVEGRGARGGKRRGAGFGRGRHGGRWNISVYHTYRFTDLVTIAPGVPVFDQLAGDALNVGGVPRHAVDVEGGVFHKGFGIRMNIDYDGPATVRSSGAPGVSDLRFGSVFRLDARIFINLGRQEKLVERVPAFKGLRLALDFDNLFDSRQKVTDEAGLVPLAYQAGYRDPRGRFMGIDIRKTF